MADLAQQHILAPQRKTWAYDGRGYGLGGLDGRGAGRRGLPAAQATAIRIG